MEREEAESAGDDWSFTSTRSRRQLGLFFAGSTFVMLSSLITRRSIARRYHLTRPAFFHPSNMHPIIPINGPLEALEALSIASINVFTYGFMFGGGLLWAFNISTFSELKSRVKMPLDLGTGEETGEQLDDNLSTMWPAAAIVLHEEQRHESQATKKKGSREGP